jgi:ubiquinone/menaquinone biosynthesis C-methylase UbiE
LNKESVKTTLEYWQNRAERFESLYHIRDEGIKKILDEVYPYLKNLRNIADVGCGTGIPTYILKKKLKINVVGVDFSKSMLKQATSKRRIEYGIRADALHLPFQNNSLEAVVCITVLTDYKDKKPFFREFHLRLKQGGILVYGDYSLNDGYWNLNQLTYPLAFSSKFKLYRESIEEIGKNLIDESFIVLSSKAVNFKVKMTIDNYISILKSRPGFKFDQEKEEKVRKIAEKYISNEELNRELTLLVFRKRMNFARMI